jgi:hypothetical protein
VFGQLVVLTVIATCVGVVAQEPDRKSASKPGTSQLPPPAELRSEAQQTREICCPPNLKQRLKSLDQIRADIQLSPGPRPMDCAASVFDVQGTAAPRERCATEFRWCPTNFSLNPPYFEETPLERYGQTPCPILQPAISTAHFFCVLSTLPYRIAVDRPCEPIYTLGYYRPGSPTPCLRQTLPCPSDPQP